MLQSCHTVYFSASPVFSSLGLPYYLIVVQFNLLLLVLSAPDLETISFFATAFMHDSRYFFLFPSFPLCLLWVKQPHFLHWLLVGHVLQNTNVVSVLSSSISPADPLLGCHVMPVMGCSSPAEPAPLKKSTKSWLYASHRPYCCLCMPAWFAPFSAVWHFWLLFSLMVTLDPLLCCYSTSCCHSVLILLTIPAHLFCAEFWACPLVWF